MYRSITQKTASLTAWLKRRADGRKGPVTADELVARIMRNWPSTTSGEIDTLYQAVGHL